MSKIDPIGENVIILPTPKQTKVEGFIVPDNAVDHPVSGTVVAAGPNAKQTAKGDFVLYPQNFGAKIMIDDVEHIVLPEAKLLTILNP